MQTRIKGLAASAVVLLATSANAVLTPVNPLGENGTSASLSLQGIIDARGNTLVNISSDADQLDNGNDWHWTRVGSASAAMVIEVAGFASNNRFGIYNAANPSQRTQIFSGGASGGASTSFSSPYSTFGFYLYNSTEGFIWYSDSSLNAGGRRDHMVAYQGKGEILDLGSNPNSPVASINWGDNRYLLGWEDLNLGDWDYNDMVVVVKNVRPINVRPVPDMASTLALLGVAVMALGVARKKMAR